MTKRNTELYSMQSPSIPHLKRQKPRALGPALFPMAMRRVLSEPSALFRVSSASGMPRPRRRRRSPRCPPPRARTHAQAPGPTQPTTMSHQKQPLHSSIGADAARLALRCPSSQSNLVVVVVGREAEASPATQPVPVRLALPIASAVAPHHAQNCQHRRRDERANPNGLDRSMRAPCISLA